MALILAGPRSEIEHQSSNLLPCLKCLVFVLATTFVASSASGQEARDQSEPEIVYDTCIANISDDSLFADSYRFQRDGHKFTTYLVARMAGLDEPFAYALSYYSQFPDLNLKYSATWVALVHLLNPFTQEWRSDITSILHSLHGGKSQKIFVRRNILSDAVASQLTSNSPQYWKAGLLIHSFGDSYAHTKNVYGSVEEKAYGSLLGHALDFHDPDQIARPDVFPKYAAYVAHLFDSLDNNANGDKNMIRDFIAELQKYVCDSHCSKNDIDDMSEAIIAFGNKSYSYSDDLYDCMKSELPPLQKADVQSAIDTAKNELYN